MKEISVGRESFAKFIENDNYFIDKTLFIKEVFKKDQSDVLLITRPRRFGKTLTMSTFYEFLRINPSNPDNPEDTSYQQKLFKDTNKSYSKIPKFTKTKNFAKRIWVNTL